jgi:hypothetical protein
VQQPDVSLEHAVSPLGHVHVPFWHVVVHTLPHDPQLLGSLLVSTQPLEQQVLPPVQQPFGSVEHNVSPVAHWQVLLMQVVSDPMHLLPHIPQLLSSPETSVHVASQHDPKNGTASVAQELPSEATTHESTATSPDCTVWHVLHAGHSAAPHVVSTSE